MAIYQIKLKGKEGMFSYNTYRAASAKDTIVQFLEETERTQQVLGDKYEPKEIELVKFLYTEDDPDNVVEKIEHDLRTAFISLQHLGDVGLCTVENSGPDIWMLETLMDMIKEKSKQIYSLLGALYDCTENKRSYFFGTKENQKQLEEKSEGQSDFVKIPVITDLNALLRMDSEQISEMLDRHDLDPSIKENFMNTIEELKGKIKPFVTPK